MSKKNRKAWPKSPWGRSPWWIFVLVLIVGALSLGQMGPQSVFSPGGGSADREMTVDAEALRVLNVVVRDLDGSVAWRGDVDLRPTLARIEAGERDPHRNDGSVFQNREGLLPQRPRGHYREYVIRTPGISHAGPQRLVIGNDGEVYYTHDHYRSFLRIR